MIYEELVRKVMAHIREAEVKRIAKMKDSLIKRALPPGDFTVDTGIMHKGQRWFHSNSARMKLNMIPVPEELMEEANMLADDINMVHLHMTEIRQMLVQVWANVQNLQDIRDAVPDSLLDAMGEPYSSLPRTRPAGYSLDAERQARFAKVARRMDSYAAMDLFI